MQTYLAPKITQKEREVLIDGIDATRALFELRDSEKEKARMESGINRGWDQSYGNYHDKNTRVEAFVFGKTNSRDISTQNKWPPALESKHRNCLKKVLSVSKEIIQNSLSSSDDGISALLERSSLDDLRAKLSFYSSLSSSIEANENIVCGAHTDFGLVTLNVSNDPKWIETTVDGRDWRRVMVPSDQPILWYGDQTLDVSDAILKPCAHRISYSDECDDRQRFGISVFLDIK